MRTLTLAASALVALSFSSASLTWALADTPLDGFEVTDLPYPGSSATVTLTSGNILAFDGLSIDEYGDLGNFLNHITTLPSFVFPSFLLLDPTESFLLLGESTNGALIKVDLNLSTTTTLTNITFNYAAVFEDASHVIVSAASLGFGMGTQVYRVDVNTGVATQFAQVAGSSGPVAVDSLGGVFYGTVSDAFPPPAGSSSVLRWTAAQTTSGLVLTEADATVVESGLDGAGALVYDAITGRLYLAENNFGSGVNRIRVIGGGGNPILLDGTSGNTISNLEFRPGVGPAEFLPYQPESAVLLYNATDFSSVFARRSLTPRRPTATCTGPGKFGAGPFDVSYFDAPAGGFAIIYYNLISTLPTNEIALNFKFPLFLGLSPVMLTRVPGTLPTDMSGAGTATYQNPGGAEGLFAMQLLLFDASAKLVGSSTLAFL